MKKLFQFTIILFILINHSYLSNAQEFKVGFQSGLGTYKMHRLKDLSNYLAYYNSLLPKVVSNYPSYFYYQPSVTFAFKKINLGFLYSFHSTGSRISIKDYSGEYRFDSKIKCHTLGTVGEINLNPEKKIKFILYSEVGVIFTKLNLTESFTVNDQSLIDIKYDFTSKSYYYEPGLKISYPLSSILFECNLGYFKQFGKGTFKTSDDLNVYTNGDLLKPDWSGLRIGISVYLVFPLW